MLRQRSRPYLFSNTLAPTIAGASLRVLELLTASTELRDKLEANTAFFRERIQALGFTILPGTHPIVPIMLGDAALAGRFAEAMLEKGAVEKAKRNLAQLQSLCGNSCSEARQLAAAIENHPRQPVLTAEAIAPEPVVTQN